MSQDNSERDLIASFVESKAEWKHCDCGCPQQRSPKTSADVKLLRLAADIRMGKHAPDAAKLAGNNKSP